jgi:hypothetical protein
MGAVFVYTRRPRRDTETQKGHGDAEGTGNIDEQISIN